MARRSFILFAALALTALLCVNGQTDLDTDGVAGNTTVTNTTTPTTDVANTTVPACPLTEDALLGVDFTNASTSCQDTNSTAFCSSCLCSIATSLVTGSPTFAALATSNSADINLNTLVEQCAGTLGPVLLSALTPDALTALAACDLNAAATTCGNLTEPEVEVEAAQGPVTPAPVQMGGAPKMSGAQGVIVSALLAAPVMLALWMA